ncbi:ATP-binding cassette domain-containing protein [Aliarcobacter butzleri]
MKIQKNLTITEDKDYVSIFPKNINVTAIVGENGSGKSSILKILT